jgi:putative esterase
MADFAVRPIVSIVGVCPPPRGATAEMLKRMCRGVLLALAASAFAASAWAAPATRFEVTVPAAVEAKPLTGRLIIAIADKPTPEPRLAIGMTGPVLAAVDIEALPAGKAAVVDAGAVSFPLDSISRLPAGDYWVQPFLVRYDKVTRSDGKTIWAPINHDRVPFTMLPGNLYGPAQKVRLDPAAGFDVKLAMDKVIGPIERPKDDAWLKQVRIKSEILSKFWGYPIYLGATVLVPKGWDEHPQARYPVVYAMSHGERPYLFNPDPASAAEDEEGAKSGNIQTGYDFYKTWTSDKFPRFLVAAVYQSSPYFLEAYSVDSANNGPYGEALTKELIPHIEKTFRGVGKPYGRIVQGASTGGWESLAMQVKYPDYFGGAWVFNPDPISFKHYQQVDIYKDENAFSVPLNPYLSIERPFRRTVEDQVTFSVRQLSRLEEVMGTKGRSGYQLEIWEATYGPVGADGYPVPLWDKLTGKIDRNVANYMRDNGYDLTEYVRANFATLGPKLDGKLNFMSGEMDNFYLNLGVYDFEDMLKTTATPGFKARFEYGRPKKGHNWHYVSFSGMLLEMADHIKRTAPAGEDMSGWNY